MNALTSSESTLYSLENAPSRFFVASKKGAPTTLIQEIVHASLAHLPEKGAEGKAMFAEMAHHIFKGEKSALDDPSFYLRNAGNVPELPLNLMQLAQLGKLVEDSPICLDRITLMELLGLSVYTACVALEMSASEIEKKRIRSCKVIFCRQWMTAYVSHANQFAFKMRWTYTSLEFTEEMKRFMDMMRERRENAQECDKNHYETLLNSIEILLHLWQSKEAYAFLQSLLCYHFRALAPWFPKEETSPERIYRNVQSWINFVECAFKHTECFHNGRKDILPLLRLSKTVFSFSFNLKEEEVKVRAAEGQKNLLKVFAKLIRENKEQTEQLTCLLTKRKNDSLETHYKRMSISMYGFVYIKLYGNIIFLMEKYVRISLPNYLTSHACLSRMDVTSKVFCQHILQVELLQTLQEQHAALVYKRVKDGQLHFPQSGFYSQLTHRELHWIRVSLETTDAAPEVKMPLMQFFSQNSIVWAPDTTETPETQKTCKHGSDRLNAQELTWILHALDTEAQVRILLHTYLNMLTIQEKQAFFEVSVWMAREVKQLFKRNEALMNYAKKTCASSQLNRSLWLILEYTSIYPMIKDHLDMLSCGLDALQKTHSQKMIELVDGLSIETCRVHKEKILGFFESLSLDLMSPFSMLATFKHDLDLLLPDMGDGRSLNSADSSIVSYFLMLKFEEYFIEKITPVRAPVAPDELCRELLVESETRLKHKTEKNVDLENQATRFKSHRRAKNQGRHPSCVQDKTTHAVFDVSGEPLAKSKRSLSPLSIRKGEKLDKIITLLHDKGLFESYSKGGHTTFEDSEGFKVTLPVHGDGHVSHTVRRSLMQRVNNKAL